MKNQQRLEFYEENYTCYLLNICDENKLKIQQKMESRKHVFLMFLGEHFHIFCNTHL